LLARTRDVVIYRDLLRNLVIRDLKVRYRGSFIGFLWSLLNPLLMMGVYWFVFTQLLKSNKPQFHIFVFVALLPWNWCAASVMGAITSIVGNGHLIKKVYFPRELLPLSVVISNGINFLFALPVLFLLIAVAGTGPELRKIDATTQPVAAVAYAPDGLTVASGADDRTVRVWRVADGAPLGAFDSQGGPVTSVAFSPDGAMLAAGSEDRTVHVWRPRDGALLRTLGVMSAPVNSVAFSPDGAYLAVGLRDGGVRLWRVAGWTAGPALNAGAPIWSLAFAPDSSRLAAAADDHHVYLWRAADWAQDGALAAGAASVVTVAFTPDSGGVAAGATDGTVRLWRVLDPAAPRVLTGPNTPIYSLAFAPGPAGATLATAGGDQKLRIWRVADGAVVQTFEGHTAKVNSVAYAPDGLTLVSGADDHTVRLWTAAGGTHMQISPNIIWLPLLIVTEALFLAGVSFFLSALNVFFRDTAAIMEVGIQAWFFLTPVFYTAEDVLPQLAYWMYWLNPMASIISSYRIILYNNGLDPLGTGPDPAFMVRTLLTSAVALVAGYLFFQSVARRFGEEL
jgi:ABC-type polysaccharide/polyol phosphate export permease